MPLDERSKADYQPWNHEEFCADVRVRRMTPAQRRSYVMLLHEAFFCSTRPYLPDNDELLEMMADCENPGDWERDKHAVRKMFEPFQDESGNKLLRHRRVEADWNRLLEKREELSEKNSGNAKKGWVKRRAAKGQQSDATVCDRIPVVMRLDATVCEPVPNDAKGSEVSEEKQEKGSEGEKDTGEPLSLEDEDIGQEDTVAIRNRVEEICEDTLGVPAERPGDPVWPRMNKLVAKHHGVGEVATMFQEWAETRAGFASAKPVAAFLRFYDGLPVEEARRLAATPGGGRSASQARQLALELNYRSNQMVTFNDREKARLEILLDEGYSGEEILSAFRVFFDGLDQSNPRSLGFAARNFVESADQIIFSARRKAQEAREQAALIAKMEESSRIAAQAALAEAEAAEAAEQELIDTPL